MIGIQPTAVAPGFVRDVPLQHISADIFPWMNPVFWMRAHFAVGGYSPMQRLSGMLTAHMTQIAPRNGFTWHPHRGLEIYTWMLEGTLYHEDSTGGKGELRAGDIQRMFSGNWIEHQELNQTDSNVHVIQIWFAADRRYANLEPHYQQLNREQLPARQVGNAKVFSLIGDDSPLEQHMQGRLTATTLAADGETQLEAPREGEDLFVYVTDGAGQTEQNTLRQYDVLLARPDMPSVSIKASDKPLHYLSFYLPRFIN